jgi:hypothetical protein
VAVTALLRLKPLVVVLINLCLGAGVVAGYFPVLVAKVVLVGVRTQTTTGAVVLLGAAAAVLTVVTVVQLTLLVAALPFLAAAAEVGVLLEAAATQTPLEAMLAALGVKLLRLTEKQSLGQVVIQHVCMEQFHEVHC